MRIHSEGKNYVLIAVLFFCIFNLIQYYFLHQIAWLFYPLLVLSFLLCFWVFWFFRIPARQKVFDPNAVLSPCDGKVVVIEEVMENEYFNDKRIQVSIFMSPLNVHVNLYPISGIVRYVKYHAGKYLVAWHPKSSTENERSTVVIANEKHEILVRQIAGAVARRIVTYSKKNDKVQQHDELGFIKFGSRVDIFLPLNTQILVGINDKVQNSITKIAMI